MEPVARSARRALLLLAPLLLAPLVGAGAPARPWLSRYNATADAGAVVTLGPARFTVLTPRVVRMEYHAASTWDDRATVNVVHRRTPVPAFTVARGTGEGGAVTVTITTAALVLRFVDDGGAAGGFTPESLSVTVLSMSPPAVWTPGTLPRGNLHGTLRTLDRVGDAVDLTCLSAWRGGAGGQQRCTLLRARAQCAPPPLCGMPVPPPPHPPCQRLVTR